VARIGQHDLDTSATWGARPAVLVVDNIIDQRYHL